MSRIEKACTWLETCEYASISPITGQVVKTFDKTAGYTSTYDCVNNMQELAKLLGIPDVPFTFTINGIHRFTCSLQDFHKELIALNVK